MQPSAKHIATWLLTITSLLATQRPLDTVAELVGFPPVAGDRAYTPIVGLGSRPVKLEVSTYRPVALRQQTFDSGSQERIKPRLAAIEVKTDGGHSPPQWLGSQTSPSEALLQRRRHSAPSAQGRVLHCCSFGAVTSCILFTK
jgi:hypothetical protein